MEGGRPQAYRGLHRRLGALGGALAANLPELSRLPLRAAHERMVAAAAGVLPEAIEVAP